MFHEGIAMRPTHLYKYGSLANVLEEDEMPDGGHACVGLRKAATRIGPKSGFNDALKRSE
jgi:hypothetical protein